MVAVAAWSETRTVLRPERGIFAKMKIFLPLVVWLVLLFRTASSQYSASRKNVGIFGLKHEVFFLNLEDGYFGCQVNESTDYLQLYELSKLCDGTSDCYMGSDELRNKLKCTNDCDKDGTACSNGACLEGQCHCNDGFGGCNCQVPDENECKYRPCDVFAHCTNTLGSFTCTCFPGYRGDGFQCVDIDECQDPAIAARCVDNAECCNLPAHFVCKCKSGFEGDGEERCTDINECLDPQACGVNAECVNVPGNYTCLCRDGFVGDPYNGCADVDECAQPGVCGPGAICTNVEGGYRCDCPAGFDGDARSAQGCADFDECTRSPCGRNALCRNDVGSFRCECPEGFHGDAMTDCQAACTATEECNQDEICAKGQCVNPCQEAGSACGMNAECRMAGHFKQCSCPAGFTGDPALECVRVPVLCSSSADCAPGMACHESMCLPRCGADQECALNEKCIGGQCMLTCRLDNDCFLGHICLNGRCVYGCHSDDDCGASETCRNNRCTDPCRDSPCGPNAACTVVNHRASCSCINGMVPSPTAKIGCIRAPALQCTENRDCTDGTSCIENVCRPICANDQGCLNNERCDRGTCKPICRRDDDCRTGEVCQGQTCMIGCRSNAGCPAELACVNQQCVDPCQEPTACGTNAICTVANHRKQCVCPAPLVGDPLVGCRAEERSCQARSDCAKGQACYGNTCMQTCRNDQNCLADERCIRGTCRTVCNSDASCSNGLICENRICQTGCRTDNNCPNNQACINKQCTDPCTVLGQCGSCSECTVVNHGVQCSCPSGYLGNPLVSCAPPPQKCNSYCYCDEEGIYCADKCRQAKDCACGQTCQRGRCRAKCNPGSCPAGQLCQNGACMAGCRSNADCPGERSCTNKKCIDPCAGGKACGKNAICQVADHQALCLCPDGFQGDPREGCVQYECQTNVDCELDKKCVAGKCTNPCLEHDACGLNAQCRVVNRQAQCSCTPGFFGNARQECQPLQKHSCSQNPCGENTVCREDANGYECTCQPGCMGDPRQGCLCEGKQTNKCHEFPCGKKAVCRVTAYDQPECYCPPLYPGGDPYVECTNERTVTDCRTTGCAEGECVRDGTQFICRNDESCANDMQCPNEKACIGGKCSDPCSLRGACGDNALCQTVLHRPRCSCPSCYIGRPNVECKPDPKCKEATTQKPSDPKIVSIACEKDADCDESLRCDASGQCNDPCTIPTTYVCDPNKKCISRRHRPVCVCKHGFIVNDYGELICAPEKRECHGDDGCASNMACIDGKCLNPCMPTATRGPACPEDKACMVMDHKPACVCMKDCSPTLSICLRDSGCPSDLACRNYQCVNPCESTQCADDTPCFVEDHKPICKFCPPGFVKDAHQGCLKELGCRHNDECSVERSCVNGVCMDPCQAGNPCEAGQECEVQNHEPVCIKLCQCQKSTDCASGSVCDGCNCIQQDTPSQVTTGCEHCPPGIPCNPITGACVKAPPGTPKIPEPCQSDADCIESEVCYMELCENPCNFDGVCAPTATCHAKMHRPICTCPAGHEGNPTIKCTPLKPIQCTSNDECPLMEACVGNLCQPPCSVKNPCAHNAVCINRNHGSECSCIEGYHGNGFVSCQPVTTPGSVCQYNEDCPPDKLCDRLNRVCINPCQEDSCGENAECLPRNHGIECRCQAGFTGNAYIECVQLHGCRSNSECGSYEACINGQCASPCQCGSNALCDVQNHKPQCRCPPGYKGDARVGCSPPSNPCDPNPCGLNAMCEIDAGSPVCFCPKGLTGNPFKNCIPEGDDCTPNPCGPNSGCRKINGKASCFCLPEFEGNPPKESCKLPQNPCDPSPCGPNTQCNILSNGFAKCTCLSGYIESPNTIRGCIEPKNPCEPNPCGFGAVCDSSHNPVCYCPEGSIGNPFRSCNEPVVTTELCRPGPCGKNADCYNVDGREQCYCSPGYVGDAYNGCVEQPRSVCEPNPCGPGAECLVLTDGSPACRCPPGVSGDPTSSEGCHGYECRVDDDCAVDKACIGFQCADPCPGSCGTGAHCKVEKHHPVCFCDAGLTGNPAIRCFQLEERVPDNQCNPSPCGVNTQCTVRNRRPVCKCLPNYKGDPKKGCRAECELNSDCPSDKACVNRRCVLPCNGGAVCGVNAECRVEYHTPMCKCPNGFTGDAFVHCVPIPEDRNMTRQPCRSSPCGPQGVCSVYSDDVALCDPCSTPDAIHNPRCRPQCVLNTDCPFNQACIQNRCQDPCPGSCGYNALCAVEQHRPVCSCPPGLYGNPYERCIQQDTPLETCDTIRCGANTDCKRMGGVLACVCKKNYFGDPLVGCRPECVINTDCPVSKACVNNRCQDPCAGVCGVNAICKVVNHLPVCYCPPTHTGDALVACTEKTYLPPDTTPCDPNPCGPNSKCLTTPDNYAVCSCLPGFRGMPPACQAECMINAECPQNKACINLKCVDPCPGTCGVGARCEVLNHNPICSCGPNQQGDPFVICESRQNEPPVESKNPCDPSPCGLNSICQVKRNRPVCSCQPNFIGSPPYCRPECVLSSECPQDKACINEKCRNPCENACGANAECHVVSHSAFCNCRPGFEGDAFIGCSEVPRHPVISEPHDPCYPSPCAENSVCSNVNGAAKCQCIAPYLGDPYNTGCRPECVLNSDCPSHLACVNQHCRDPCPGVCGSNAECTIANHIPVCECSRGYVGDPFRGCRKEVPQPIVPKDPCAQCPSNSVCRIIQGRPTCSCPEGYRGAPPACRPECSSNEECRHDQSCINLKCKDPCPGLCGVNAQCQVINHKPFCSCLKDYYGNPFEQCMPKPAEPVHPCQPSPCGPYSECRELNDRAVCSCVPGMLGTPPNCRPECETHQECPSNRACFGQKCKDPCIGSCGFNALCAARDHRPECSCMEGFEGDPYTGCNPIVIHEPPAMPCTPSPCGANAVCREQNGAGSCSCLPEYFGDPYVGCRPECVMNSDCPRTRSCINSKCVDPCPGTCGGNSECHVVNHAPTCTCIAGYIGNPFTACTPQPEIREEPINPCEPSPCGPNSHCRVINNHAVCSCRTNFIGTPPSCRPECVVSSECPLDKACIGQRCKDPCPGTCGINARCQVTNHNPICSCKQGFTGDPFVRCIPEDRRPVVSDPPRNPCEPSPCGPNSQCKTVGNTAACSCLPNYIGRAPNCRPECTSNSECSSMQACINEKCKNPCPGSCGTFATCVVQNHQPSCKCYDGYTGDPYSACMVIPIQREPEIVNPCNPSPCGVNAECNVRNNAGSCTCLPDYFGDPYHECRPECVLNTDCPKTRSCLNNKCKDPCPGMCGLNAECSVSNHAPTCSCIAGFTGNPSVACHEIPKLAEPIDPCRPSPCGPYSECRVVNQHAVCSCQKNYIGTPPACRPECTVSSECPQDKACMNQRCIDPCPGTCGLNARCNVINHNPICSCSPGFTGDPFIRCLPEEKRPEPKEPQNPCIPSPCGPNSQCRAVGSVPACSCLPNYIGRAPNCRPECTINSECAGNLACINEKCRDPCPGSCGSNAICNVIKHSPVCSCSSGYTGDPFSGCMDIPPPPIRDERQDPCNPSPCGSNAVCKERNGAGSCTCLPEYFGDPYSGCRPECVTNSDCPRNKACVNNKCKDPCPGVCGINAECYVVNHSPSCSCISGYTGDPLSACHEPAPPKQNEPLNPCSPSPCGPNSLCREINGHAVCSCQTGFIGTPPSCRPECVVSTECAQDKACISQKCQDPCPGTCGQNARCQVVNHSPICSCTPGFTGDPFIRCLPEEKRPVVSEPIDPCVPSPCGPNSQCRAVGSTPACSCLPNYIGRAPNCRPECMINAECPANLACVNEKCKDPCVGSCGLNALCTVIKHNPVCECQRGFTGDPFSVCTEYTPPRAPEPVNPCNPSPCGANAVCKERNGAGSCTCLPEYFGDPYTGCRPECVQNSDCDKFRACVNNKCKDPCPGVCGLNAECRVQNHSPICFCLEGYTGDPARGCSIEERVTERPRQEGCSPSPCGPNSQCREVNGHPVCSCQSGYIGTPPSCRPECVVSSECSQDRACLNQKCADPCPGTCGTDARCQVVNHNPICSCSPGFTGDPFIRCIKKEVERDPPEPINPCLPSPCGPNSQCRVVGTQAACTCQANYIGRPPNCRPECTNDAECASNRACQNERCVDPCPGACGSNAICQVINHRAVCTCSDGFEGNPLVQCDRSLPPTTERLTPCTPSPCGPNAECRERNNAGACYCLPNYEGNPYDVFSGCRRECDVNSDCAEKLACVNFKCVDPCPGVCGSQALCDIVNHVPTCVCPEGMIGDPFTRCELRLEEPITRAPPVCDQNTCGPNSICRIQNGVAVCKCQPEMTGTPPNCRPECVQSGDCESQRACVNYKCIDPCPGSCGQNAKCQVINHNPICSCSPDFTGDPFSRCYKEVRTTTPAPPTPCVPSPCGPNAECKVVGSKEACSCLPDYTGSPPNCRPECVLSTECAQNQACIRQKCTDPCPGSCGLNAKCTVVNHTPSCSCEEGYTGDPFTGCQFIQAKPPPEVDRSPPEDPCYPSPCGTNARCRPVDGGAVCECFENYFGNPYTSCRPECVTNSECSRNTACIQNRCKDPCPGVCGHNAECSVINHTPTCTCREGMVGNAFEQCLREEKPPAPSDPCYPSPCGLNTVCRSSGGNAVCECLPDFKGTPFGRGCYPECTINSDCPRDKTCVNKKCVDPCPGVCGYRAVCHAINNSPVCSCPNNMIGDPFVECKEAAPKDPCNPSPCRTNGICRVVGGRAECQYPECVINSDCSPNRACFNQKCRDPCVGACGVNAICNVVNHAPICSCPERHVGSPFVQCNRQMDPVPQPECVSDDQCTNDKACINQQCVNPCSASNGLCNLNAECRVQFHRAICTCRDGYTGNAQIACYEIGCRSDSDCPATEACVNKNCIDPCRYTQCGRNAVCKTDYNHNARCHCIDGYRGNALTGCTRPECTRDDECPYHLSCQNEQCRDPCDCAPGAQCRVDNHRASCRCPPGYTGDASFACEKIPVRDPDQCKMDADCSSRLACFSGTCKNPCLEAKPCAQHAVCTVQDTLPLRTMYCVCEEGYVGDAEKQCLPVSPIQPGCSSDIECAATETCRNRACVNPCTEFNPCARTAECLAQSHKAICSCPVGMVGDPFQNCYREPVITPECTVDSECPSNRACINQKCQDPCADGNPCAGNAECRTLTHRPLCMCPQGWGGDPKVQCYKPECQRDSDCPYDKACYNEKCLNPCTYGATQCGRGAECLAQGHRANCICPAGTQGNPLISCVTGLCQYNEDCADHEACDRLNRVCRPVCDDETCASRATCIGRNHQATCECAPGTRGNPYVECARDEPEPVCRTDGDCPSQQACINSMCSNPCTVISPCSRQQSCSVVDTLPLRTMICACPTDMLVDANGQCKPIVVEGCRKDNDCPDTDRCMRGQCMLACRAEPCGVNAQCVSSGHRAKCSCAAEYVGNPHIECTPEGRVPSPKECSVDDDCPLDRSCLNERCINPCTQDVCGRGAICHVQLHNAVCNCPAGYKKDANNNCVPPVADLPKCRANSDCATSETCVNEICANPCNCGQNADCYVKDHYPVCSCKPGYSGNAQFGCFKLGCQSDSECANDKQCYNGECLNPCALENPCALNAECFGDKHRAACRCLPGLEGNPFVQCRRVECHFDGECPDNRACLQEQCIDPCSEMAPCAQNAICFTRGHAPHCKCPDHLPDGNPFSFCERRVVQHKPECTMDTECPSRLACINNKCVDPCRELEPCARSAKCTVLDSVPVRTMVCECPELHVPDVNGECKRIVLQTPPECSSDSECSDKEACINRQCRNPCNCGDHSTCMVKNHRGICSCEDGYEGNPNIACRTIGCRIDSECESGKACINGNCVNPCLDNNPCGINAECYAVSSHAECRCLSGYRGNPMVQCTVVECRSNNDCPNDKQCRNTQCVDPCIYDSSCSPRAECKAQNHLAVCRCPTGLVGNPYVDCRPEIIPECVYDTDCPSHLACIENKCVEPCGALEPCNRPARCEAIPSSPVRTMICICPDGYVSSGSGTCKPVVKSGCISDSDCSSDTACINSICRNPCNCGPNAECRIKDHKPVCSCKQGFDGNPEIECIKIECRVDDDCSSQHSCLNRQCVPVCSLDSCGRQAECYAQNHRAICECLPGYEGDPRATCKLLGCRADSECPLDKACINQKCENPCENQAICAQNELCQVYQHRPECACPPPFEADPIRGCVLRDERCRTDGECPSQTACIQGECVNPCNVTEPCGVNSMCKVLDTLPVRTMICECLPGYQGNAAVQCDKMALCPTDRGFVRNANGECACPPGYGLTIYEDCQICREEDGLKIDETGRCVCALERGMVIDERGRCICPVDYGYRLTERGECIRTAVPECTRDSDCPDWRHCHQETRTCEDPCKTKICGKNALCNATNHQAICQCIAGYTGNPEEHCNQTTNFRTDFPQPEMQVTCQADGVQVVIDLMESNFNGVLYVKGHSKDEECRRVVNLAGDASQRTQIFKVHFGSCGLIHVNGIASFVLVIQKHPKLVTYKAQAYHIKCVYQTGEQNVTLGFNVQMLTTAGTIANTGPPPTCAMRIVAFNGEEIVSAEIGDNLRLQVEVQPATIYGGFARSCVAKTMEDSVENEYIVTDENGCATEPSIFGDWEYNAETNSLLASFNAFKFPSSDNIRFQCNIRVCFGKCQPVNCHGANAYGKRRRRAITDANEIEMLLNRTRRATSSSSTALAGDDDELGIEGTLREEITIQSNAILTLDRREERSYDSDNITPAAQRVEDICVSMIGLIIALVITALLALVAVAVAVSCWLMAYRRRPTVTGPLPHPPEFPNPLFAHHEPSEPSHHDYMT